LSSLDRVVEAVSFLDVPLDNIDILSIGTTSEPFNIAKHGKSGIVQWNAGLINLMFNAQVEAARAQAKLLTGGHLHRIDYIAPTGQFSLDDARLEKIEQLIAIGRKTAVEKEHLDIVRARFLNNEKAQVFAPCHRL
jgi:hypothetical protein